MLRLPYLSNSSLLVFLSTTLPTYCSRPAPLHSCSVQPADSCFHQDYISGDPATLLVQGTVGFASDAYASDEEQRSIDARQTRSGSQVAFSTPYPRQTSHALTSSGSWGMKASGSSTST